MKIVRFSNTRKIRSLH